MPKHRRDMRDALVKLFEEPVPENYKAGRQVLHSILGSDDLPLDRSVLCFATNPILSAMAKPGLTPLVWETKTSWPLAVSRSWSQWKVPGVSASWNS